MVVGHGMLDPNNPAAHSEISTRFSMGQTGYYSHPVNTSAPIQSSICSSPRSAGETFIEKRTPTHLPLFDSAGAIPRLVTRIRKSAAEQSIASAPLNQNDPGEPSRWFSITPICRCQLWNETENRSDLVDAGHCCRILGGVLLPTIHLLWTHWRRFDESGNL
jgi:hypothetical protein